jgi:hypothetical protein
MWMPSHTRHIDGLSAVPPNMRTSRIPVLSAAGFTDVSMGAKNVGRTVSTRVPTTCAAPATISGIVPAMNHPCSALAVTTGTTS